MFQVDVTAIHQHGGDVHEVLHIGRSVAALGPGPDFAPAHPLASGRSPRSTGSKGTGRSR
jgi:hypothetical protein